jgi:hypothetical protein
VVSRAWPRAILGLALIGAATWAALSPPLGALLVVPALWAAAQLLDPPAWR